MPPIKIDNQDYDLNTLSEEAKAQLAMLPKGATGQ